MTFDIEGAKQAGYSEAEIADYLASKNRFDVAGARKAGYSDAEILQHFAPALKEEPKPDNSLGRQIGLTARAGLGAIGSIPNLVADPAVSLLNRVAGTNLPIPSQALERTMTRAGLPEPANEMERASQTISRSMAMPSLAARALPQFAAQLGTQTTAAGLGAAGSETARVLGGGPLAQFLTGAATGIVPTAAGIASIEAAKAARNAAPALIEPLTDEGRRRIAARAVQGAASDPGAAARAAQGAPEYVPGSAPTLAQASGDTGLALMEKAVRARNPEAFAMREVEQDAARRAGLQRSFGTQADISLAEAERDAATSAMREAAFEGAKRVSVKPIMQAADAVLMSGAGGRQEVERAMLWVKSRLRGETDPQRIYAVRQDINDIIAGKMKDPEKASYQLAASQLKAVKAALDRQLEKAAPGFREYLKTYAGMSREIDKAQLGQDITARATNPMTERISPAQFTREFEKRGEEIANAGPVASDSLTRVAMDLRRAAAPMALGKTPGSDTLQNMVAQGALSRAGFSDGVLPNAASRALGWLYRPTGAEDAVQGLLRDAFLDPKQGAGLLSAELSRNPILMDQVLRRLLAAPYGGLLGAGVASQ